MELEEFMNWAVGGVGSGVVAYLVIRHLKFTFVLSGREFTFDLEALSPLAKRRLGVFLPGVLALAAWGLTLLFGYNEMPAERIGWFETAFQIALAPVVASIMHGEIELKAKDEDAPDWADGPGL